MKFKFKFSFFACAPFGAQVARQRKEGISAHRAGTLLRFSVPALLLCWLLLPSAVVARVTPALKYVEPPVLAAQGTVQAAFAPNDDVEGLIVKAIRAARQQILVQAYLLSSRPITKALAAAHARGIEVRILVDKERLTTSRGSGVPALARSGVPVQLEVRYRNAHNKVIIIDAASTHSTLITGSFNFTYAAQRQNAENLLIIRDFPALTHAYVQNWQRHSREALPYKSTITEEAEKSERFATNKSSH